MCTNLNSFKTLLNRIETGKYSKTEIDITTNEKVFAKLSEQASSEIGTINYLKDEVRITNAEELYGKYLMLFKASTETNEIQKVKKAFLGTFNAQFTRFKKSKHKIAKMIFAYLYKALDNEKCEKEDLTYTIDLDSFDFHSTYENLNNAELEKLIGNVVDAHLKRSVYWDNCEDLNRVYLNASYKQRVDARQNGGIFDTFTKQWYYCKNTLDTPCSMDPVGRLASFAKYSIYKDPLGRNTDYITIDTNKNKNKWWDIGNRKTLKTKIMSSKPNDFCLEETVKHWDIPRELKTLAKNRLAKWDTVAKKWYSCSDDEIEKTLIPGLQSISDTGCLENFKPIHVAPLGVIGSPIITPVISAIGHGYVCAQEHAPVPVPEGLYKYAQNTNTDLELSSFLMIEKPDPEAPNSHKFPPPAHNSE